MSETIYADKLYFVKKHKEEIKNVSNINENNNRQFVRHFENYLRSYKYKNSRNKKFNQNQYFELIFKPILNQKRTFKTLVETAAAKASARAAIKNAETAREEATAAREEANAAIKKAKKDKDIAEAKSAINQSAKEIAMAEAKASRQYAEAAIKKAGATRAEATAAIKKTEAAEKKAKAANAYRVEAEAARAQAEAARAESEAKAARSKNEANAARAEAANAQARAEAAKANVVRATNAAKANTSKNAAIAEAETKAARAQAEAEAAINNATAARAEATAARANVARVKAEAANAQAVAEAARAEAAKAKAEATKAARNAARAQAKAGTTSVGVQTTLNNEPVKPNTTNTSNKGIIITTAWEQHKTNINKLSNDLQENILKGYKSLKNKSQNQNIINKAFRIIMEYNILSYPEIFKIINPKYKETNNNINPYKIPIGYSSFDTSLATEIINKAEINTFSNILLLGTSGSGKTYFHKEYIHKGLIEKGYQEQGKRFYIWGMVNPFFGGPYHYTTLTGESLDFMNRVSITENNKQWQTLKILVDTFMPKYNGNCKNYEGWTPLNERSSRAQTIITYKNNKNNKTIKVIDCCGTESPDEIWRKCYPEISIQEFISKLREELLKIIKNSTETQNELDKDFTSKVFGKYRSIQTLPRAKAYIHIPEFLDIIISTLTKNQANTSFERQAMAFMNMYPIECILLSALEVFTKVKTKNNNYTYKYRNKKYQDFRNLFKEPKKNSFSNFPMNTLNKKLSSLNENIIIDQIWVKQIYLFMRCLEGFYITPTINTITYNMIYKIKYNNYSSLNNVEDNSIEQNYQIVDYQTKWETPFKTNFLSYYPSFLQQSHILYNNGLNILNIKKTNKSDKKSQMKKKLMKMNIKLNTTFKYVKQFKNVNQQKKQNSSFIYTPFNDFEILSVNDTKLILLCINRPNKEPDNNQSINSVINSNFKNITNKLENALIQARNPPNKIQSRQAWSERNT